jgi:hypothetical protein
VNYLRVGDEVVIRVGLPGAKNWWRNFLGGGGPITLRLNGTDRTGHAVATATIRAGCTQTGMLCAFATVQQEITQLSPRSSRGVHEFPELALETASKLLKLWGAILGLNQCTVERPVSGAGSQHEPGVRSVCSGVDAGWARANPFRSTNR